MTRWRGLKALVHDAIDATTDLVREGHDAAHRNVRRVTDRIEPIARPAAAVDDAVQLGTAGVLRTVTVVNRVVEALTDAALDASVPAGASAGAPIPLRSDALGTPAWIADAALGAVNGAVGDHLATRGNGLDLGLVLRRGDKYLTGPGPAALDGCVVVLVHGLGTTEWCWSLDADAWHGDPTATFGSLLQRDAGLTPLFVRYNTGRAIGRNGRELAEALERQIDARRVSRIVLVGHSMGGLVSRSACRAAADAGHAWIQRVDTVISLGTPHQGAPLARFGRSATAGLGAVDLPSTRVLAALLAGRSAGIRDLEHGELSEIGPDPDASAAPAQRAVPWVEGVRYAFLSATATADPDHPIGRWVGDLLVRVDSASGPLDAGHFPIRVPTFGGVLHHRFQCHPDVYAQVLRLASR